MGKILPILLALIGLGAGIGGGLMLQPPAEMVELHPCGDGEAPPMKDEEDAEPEIDPGTEFVKLGNQFVVPVVNGSEVSSLVVLSVSLEVKAGNREIVFQREPKLQDALLQALFDHANIGGFDGVYTEPSKTDLLRTALLESARMVLGEIVVDALVTNIVRQNA